MGSLIYIPPKSKVGVSERPVNGGDREINAAQGQVFRDGVT
jgi:hypothetical protein